MERGRGTGNGERGTGNGERGTGNGERGTGNGERGTGNGERGMEVWKRVYSGNLPENLRWRTKEKKRLEEEQFVRRRCGFKSMSVSTGCAPDDQYVLARAETAWNRNKQSMEYACEKIDSVFSNATPVGHYKMQNAGWVQNAD